MVLSAALNGEGVVTADTLEMRTQGSVWRERLQPPSPLPILPLLAIPAGLSAVVYVHLLAKFVPLCCKNAFYVQVKEAPHV